jgi:hypothetical protein
MNCIACPYTGPALATMDPAGKPLNICPECQTPITPKAKPWETLGIPRTRYLGIKPWKAAKMERKAFEAILDKVTPEALDCLKREAEAESLVEAMGLMIDS